MKIGILTQPLLNNYGGLLQNYALQQVLKRMGHDPITIDYLPKSDLIGYLLSCLKTIFLFLIPSKRRKLSSHPRRRMRKPQISVFVESQIKKTRIVSRLSASLIKEYGLEALIVGSDQVWRPIYNSSIEDMFLAFVKDDNLIRISYAASFGTDSWEFTDHQTSVIGSLIKKFVAVSVREDSGIILCRDYLRTEALQVLDPTLLLEVEDYQAMCKHIPISKEKYILAYVLDMTDEKRRKIETIGLEKELNVRYYSAEGNASLKVEEWVAQFRDASYIVTDSFHGTVFSIIFNHNFLCLENEKRGNSRLTSIINIYENNLVLSMKDLSISFLKKELNSK